MRLRTVLKVGVIIGLLIMVMPAAHRAEAATATIGAFYAGCGNFSVDVAVSGYTNDGNNVDRFWYQITDSNGKKLYTEYAERPVGTTAGSMVMDLSYDAEGIADGAPTKNPIKFQVIDLDSNNNLGAELAFASYDAPCLDSTPAPTRRGLFGPPKRLTGIVTATSQMFLGPNASGALNLYAKPGAEHLVMYRNSDGTWVSIWIGGNDLVWIPASAINVNVSQLALAPTRIDHSSLDAATTGITAPAAPSNPGGITARVQAEGLRMRNAPNYRADTVVTLPYGATVSVIGSNAARTYIKVSYNGAVGWVSAYYVRLSAGRVSSLPVVT